MQVEIRTGGGGVECWNAEAITRFAAEVDEREAQLAQANPDLAVLPGRVKCYGCMIQDYGYGIRCSAELTRTRYAVRGELEPRLQDAAANHLEIPALLTIKPGTEGVASPEPAAASSAAAAHVPPAPARRSGLRQLFHRD
jgi:hypothetical protein